MKRLHVAVLTVLLTLSGCHPSVLKDDYNKQYSHLAQRRDTLKHEPLPSFSDSKRDFLVILVDAKHLDYSSPETLLSTIAKHPDGTTERDIGHAWIVLNGIKDGKRVVIEGGHSGELGLACPRYLDTVFLHSHNDPNPVSYLHKGLPDGYFEEGPGMHKPTYAIKIYLSKDEFLKIYKLLQPGQYNFANYSLTENQCTTLAQKAASIAGLSLETEITIDIPQTISFQGREVRLWSDPIYKTITVPTPDVLEKSMIEAVQQGKALPALKWYRNKE